MIIEYYTKQVYGVELYYLVPTREAQAILGLIKQKTIINYQMKEFEKLGITFKRVFEPKQ